MELSARHGGQEEEEEEEEEEKREEEEKQEEEEEETPADAGFCRICHPITGVIVSMLTLTIVTTGLFLSLVLCDSRCRVCPGGWLWWRRHCYYFSVGLEENRQWSGSAEFCRGHNGSLVVIKDSAEMEFIQGVMNRFPHFPFLWVGLTDAQQEGRWLWGDGTDVQHYMPLAVDWDADHRDCADLRGGGSLFAADCDAYGPWVCVRES
ncbi:C-type lectin domain family 12 member B-like isoform X2 [Pleuronectes platessa]|uniref:C-type lectin domain family 12 member B-like isoform X2 n=1 Tax=Pleuronectes platessa TaxID=8262 RepID=UPI00232A0F83|nr:C-type lectin domain family 12 member B-like isoform X2 [Pleuronectes platessa]XP_053271580.1 C-type lectin domain family 12 member B-like isoform X2 [Pleuronectes platessa]